MCDYGQKVGYDNCTWEPDFKIVKTISATCAGLGQCSGNYTLDGDNLRAKFQSCPGLQMTPPPYPWNQQ